MIIHVIVQKIVPRGQFHLNEVLHGRQVHAGVGEHHLRHDRVSAQALGETLELARVKIDRQFHLSRMRMVKWVGVGGFLRIACACVLSSLLVSSGVFYLGERGRVVRHISNNLGNGLGLDRHGSSVVFRGGKWRGGVRCGADRAWNSHSSLS